MVRSACASRARSLFGGVRKCTTEGIALERLLNFTKGLAEHLNTNYARGHPTGNAPNHSVCGWMALATMQAVRFDSEDLLGRYCRYCGGSDHVGPKQLFHDGA